MGAMDNDLNRCNFMFSNDRRCRNLIHTPGAPFCYFHANPRSKKPKPDSAADGAADRALFQWLAAHPLDSVTNVNHAVNLIALLLAGERISVRRADALLRLFRVAMKSVPDVHKEFINERVMRRHWPQGDRFLREIQPLLAASAPASPDNPQPSPDPSPDPGPAAAPVPPLLPPTAAALHAPSRTGSLPVRPSVPTQNSTPSASPEPGRACSPPQHSTDSAPPVIPAPSQVSAPTPREVGSPRPTTTPPAPPPVAPLPSPSGTAQPNRDSLPADLSPKEVRSILRALLAAPSASRPARNSPASGQTARRDTPPRQAPP